MFDLKIQFRHNPYALVCEYGDFLFECGYKTVDDNYQIIDNNCGKDYEANYIAVNIPKLRDCHLSFFNNSLKTPISFSSLQLLIDSFENKIIEYLENYINDYYERTLEQTQVICRTLFLALKDLNKKCQEVIANQ
jgi:hypothetical protein